MTDSELAASARRIRGSILRMSHAAGTAHLGSSLSCVDILVAAFSTLRTDPKRPDDPDRDRIILSKGHAVSALYAVLAERGFPDERQCQQPDGKHAVADDCGDGGWTDDPGSGADGSRCG